MSVQNMTVSLSAMQNLSINQNFSRWRLSTTPRGNISDIRKTKNSQLFNGDADQIEKIFIGLLGAMIGACVMTIIFFFSMLYKRQCRDKQYRMKSSEDGEMRTRSLESQGTVSSVGQVSRNSSRKQEVTTEVELAIDEPAKPINELQQFAEGMTDNESHSTEDAIHRQSKRKNWAQKIQNSRKRFRSRPPKPTPRTKLPRRIISKMIQESSKKKGVYEFKQGCKIKRRFSSWKEAAEPYDSQRDCNFHNKQWGGCDDFQGCDLNSVWIEVPRAYTDIKPTKSTPRRKAHNYNRRLRSTSDPRDCRYHNYVNYPIKSAPERIGEDGKLNTKLYITGSLSHSSDHDYVNLETELPQYNQQGGIVKGEKKKPIKSPRFNLKKNSRKISPLQDAQLEEVSKKERDNDFCSSTEIETESDSKIAARKTDDRLHVEIDELQKYFN